MNFNIYYPTPPEYWNPDNDNIDVCIEFENGRQYTVVVITPDNLKFLMEKDGTRYVEPASPFLIAKRLDIETIEKLITDLVQSGDFFMKAYGGDSEA